jgi:hypothetical protein
VEIVQVAVVDLAASALVVVSELAVSEVALQTQAAGIDCDDIAGAVPDETARSRILKIKVML